MNTIKAIAYVSRVKVVFDQQKIDKLLEDSRRFNLQHNVTGVLLYNTSFFFQYIEGGFDGVSTVYDRIQRANSHEILLEVFNDEIDQKNFTKWCMGFCYSPEGIIQKLSQETWLSKVTHVKSRQDKSHGLQMLMTFWNNMNMNPQADFN